MKLSSNIGLISELIAFTLAGLGPTLKAVVKTPSLLFHLNELSRLFMSHVWTAYGNSVDEGAQSTKKHLITPNAHGIVLDIGAGHGHTINYLDRTKVTRYIAVEPNTHMHSHIRAFADALGFHESDGSLIILSCSADEVQSQLALLHPPSSSLLAQVNTIVCILTLCTIPSPEETLTKLVRDVLEPGGQLLYYEHVLNHRDDVAWWQHFWAPIWQIPTDGCQLNRATDRWIPNMRAGGTGVSENMWKEGATWGKEGDPEDSLFWHQAGRYVKR